MGMQSLRMTGLIENLAQIFVMDGSNRRHPVGVDDWRRRDLDFATFTVAREEMRRPQRRCEVEAADYLLRNAARRSARLAAGACLPCAAASAAAMLGSSV